MWQIYKWQAIYQSIPFQPSSVNAFPMKPAINSSYFCLSKSCVFPIHQTFLRKTFMLYGKNIDVAK